MFHTATHLLRCVCRSLRAPWRNPLAKSPSALLSHCWQRVRILSNYSCYYHDSSSSYYYYYYDDDYYGNDDDDCYYYYYYYQCNKNY